MKFLAVAGAALALRVAIDQLAARRLLSARRAALLLPSLGLAGGLVLAALSGTAWQVAGVFLCLFALVLSGNAWLAYRGDRRVPMTSRSMPSTDDGFRAAIQDLSRHLDRHPRDAAALSNRAVAYASVGRFAEARADFDQAIEIEPTESMHFLGRATVRQTRGDGEGALADARRAIMLAPDAPTGYAFRGRLNADLGDLAAAITDYDAAIDRGEGNLVPVREAALARLRRSARDPRVTLPDADAD